MRITVCVTTYRRPDGLRRLLEALDRLDPPDVQATVEIVVVNNDATDEGRAACRGAVEGVRTPVRVVEEPRRGIAYARNTAIDAALPGTDLVAFVDDDEAPRPAWLAELVRVRQAHDADVVTGPVLPRFEHEVPAWIEAGEFFGPGRRPTGTRMDRAYTGNVLVRAQVFRDVTPHFDERTALTGGEDSHFFQRVTRAGRSIVWADDAIVDEWQPPERTTVRWLVRRMYRTGTTAAFVSNDLRGPLAAKPVTAAKGVVWLAIGAGRSLVGVVAGRRRLVAGLRSGAYGAGLLAGLFGARCEEYR